MKRADLVVAFTFYLLVGVQKPEDTLSGCSLTMWVLWLGNQVLLSTEAFHPSTMGLKVEPTERLHNQAVPVSSNSAI